MGWRNFRGTNGPYERFAVAYPRDWEAIPSKGGEILRLQPGGQEAVLREAMSRTPLTLEHLLSRASTLQLTLAPHPVAIAGPQALFDVIGELARTRGLPIDRRDVVIDRWGDDAWAGSWSWIERRKGSPAEISWTFAVGHDQGVLLALVHGPREGFGATHETVATILGTIRLNGAALLAPEFFSHALCELLNDRHGPGTPDHPQPWTTDREGLLHDGHHSLHLSNLYRAYLLHGNLDAVAGAVEALPGEHGAAPWLGRHLEDLLPSLRVVLRRPEHLEHLTVMHVALPGGLVACPVIDSEDRLTFIPERVGERWGLGTTDLVDRAVAQLETGDPLLMEEVRDEDGGELIGVRFAADDAYDSGRLLCPRLRRALSVALGDPLLVAMPAAERIWVFRDSPRAREILLRAARRDYDRRPRPLSPVLWLWAPEGLRPLP